jgi:quinol-cytochrome oxidoreductase complex cytochrome b subunit
MKTWRRYGRPGATLGARVYRWIDDRAGLGDLLHSGLYEAVPSRGAWFNTLGSVTLILIVLQVVTGIFLLMDYIPAVDRALPSLQQMESNRFGAIVAGLHLWGAYVLLFVIGLHGVRTFVTASYKRPRELNWITGVIMFLLVLGIALFGAFLPWDQPGYWTAVVVTNTVSYVPVIGDWLRLLLRGSVEVSQATLSRSFAIHIWLLPAVLLPLIGVHLYLLRRHGEFGSWVNYRGGLRTPRKLRLQHDGSTPEPLPAEVLERPVEPPYPAFPSEEQWAVPLETVDFYPYQIFKDAAASLVVVLVVFGLSFLLGAPLLGPPDPRAGYTPVPEWFFLPLDQLLLTYPGQWLIPLAIFVIPGVGTLFLLLLPFLDRDPERSPFERPQVMVVGMFAIGIILVLTLLGSGRLFNL